MVKQINFHTTHCTNNIKILKGSSQNSDIFRKHVIALTTVCFVSIKFLSEFFLQKKVNVQNWQCCLKRRPREANVFPVPPFAAPWHRTVDSNSLFLIYTSLRIPWSPKEITLLQALTFSRLMTYIYIYICRTAPLTSRCCISYIYSTNIRTEYFKHAAHSPFYSSSKRRLFHNATFFCSCIIHILNTGVLKFKRKFRRLKVKEHNFFYLAQQPQ